MFACNYNFNFFSFLYDQQQRRRQRSIKSNGDFATEINSASVAVLLEAEVVLGENPQCTLILITTISVDNGLLEYLLKLEIFTFSSRNYTYKSTHLKFVLLFCLIISVFIIVITKFTRYILIQQINFSLNVFISLLIYSCMKKADL